MNGKKNGDFLSSKYHNFQWDKSFLNKIKEDSFSSQIALRIDLIVFSKEEVEIIQKYMDTESPENISDTIRKELGIERCLSSIRTKINNTSNNINGQNTQNTTLTPQSGQNTPNTTPTPQSGQKTPNTTPQKPLKRSNTDETDHQLLHGSFSNGCKVGTTNQGILYGVEEEKENLMFKFVGSAPNKPAGSTLTGNSSIEDVQVMCIQRYGLVVSKDIGSTIYQMARSSNISTEAVLDDLIENGKFDEELSRLVSCITDGINGVARTSANEVYNNTIGWNDFKFAVQQEISIGKQFNFQKLKELLVVPFNVQEC
ncbi:hypothetical protein ACTFIZ_000247 [Dictyostelium cf. discoideum]